MPLDNLTQDDRLIAVETSLGKDHFLLTGFSGQEGVSRLFQFDLEMLAADDDAKHTELVGQNLTFSIATRGGKRTFFNGFISQFSAAELVEDLGRLYRMRVVPWLWFLTRTANSRIFYKDKTIQQIIEQIFADHGFADYSFRLTRDYKPYEYKVQYRETDFNFISRLLEHEGIFYFFKHENGRHTAIFADSAQAFAPGEPARASFSTIADWQHIQGWHHSYEFQPGRWKLTDYDFKKPQADLAAEERTVIDNQIMKDYEIFDYPGLYLTKEAGQTLARTRIEMEEAEYHLVNGFGMIPSFRTGTSFTLVDHPVPAENNARYALLSIHHNARDASYFGGNATATYSNSFVCLPAETVYRPARVTPVPVVHGPQTATVVGRAGEEIDPDEYGRVTVQFRWDRYGKADDKSSIPLRVAQSWAGNKWGGQIIPRIGMEVVVEFLEGDPDRPIVTGCLNNADMMPPDVLPDNKTRSIFRTNSTPNGRGFNEISFEDKKGKEQLFFRAERDHHVRVKRQTREWIGENRHLIIRSNQREKVGGNKHLIVGGDQNEKIGGTVSLIADGDLHQKIEQNVALKAGMNIAIEAGITITLKAGSSFIEIGPAGIKIEGAPIVGINSGGSPGPLTAQPHAALTAREADDRRAPGPSGRALTGQAPAPGAPPVLIRETVGGGDSPQAEALRQAAKSGAPFCAICG